MSLQSPDNTMASNEPLLDKDGDDTMAGNTEAEAAEAKAPETDEPKIKRSPNRLMVDDVSEVVQGDGDNSCVLLSVTKMEGTSTRDTLSHSHTNTPPTLTICDFAHCSSLSQNSACSAATVC